MARADRLERLDALREAQEADYREALVAALRKTASGTWGLFAHTADKAMAAATAPIIAELEELAASIADKREKLFLEPFTLHDDFMAARGPVRSDQVGEPKQARAWLVKLGEKI